MCKLKSALILKNRIFMPDYDSHSDMLNELGMEDDYINASKAFVRAELYPKDGDPFSDIDAWEFHVDQDITPDWFDKTKAESEMRDAVKEWAKTHIFQGVDGLSLTDGADYCIKDCQNVFICGSASVDRISGSARVKRICDSASVENICGSASVEYIYGSASVEYIYGSASVEYIYGSASVKNICGSASVENIYDSASVEYIYGSASVKNIYDSASVKYISDSASVKNIYDSASVCTSKFRKWDNLHDTLLRDNATIKDNYSKTIYQAGDWKIKSVKCGKIR